MNNFTRSTMTSCKKIKCPPFQGARNVYRNPNWDDLRTVFSFSYSVPAQDPWLVGALTGGDTLGIGGIGAI